MCVQVFISYKLLLKNAVRSFEHIRSVVSAGLTFKSVCAIGQACDGRSSKGLFIWIITVYCAAFGRSNRP